MMCVRASWSGLLPGIFIAFTPADTYIISASDTIAVLRPVRSFPVNSAQRRPPSLNTRYIILYIIIIYNHNNSIAHTSSLPSFAPLNHITPTALSHNATQPSVQAARMIFCYSIIL